VRAHFKQRLSGRKIERMQKYIARIHDSFSPGSLNQTQRGSSRDTCFIYPFSQRKSKENNEEKSDFMGSQLYCNLPPILSESKRNILQ